MKVQTNNLDRNEEDKSSLSLKGAPSHTGFSDSSAFSLLIWREREILLARNKNDDGVIRR